MIHKISAAHLTIEEVGAILENHATLELSDDARQRIVRCRKYLDKKIAESDVPDVYKRQVLCMSFLFSPLWCYIISE